MFYLLPVLFKAQNIRYFTPRISFGKHSPLLLPGTPDGWRVMEKCGVNLRLLRNTSEKLFKSR